MSELNTNKPYRTIVLEKAINPKLNEKIPIG